MKLLIYGAGVLGSLYAARLQQAGHDVSILARGQRLADIRKHGLVLQDAATGQCTTTQVGVVEKLEPEDAYDLVVVLVRKSQLVSVLPALAANRHTPNVLFMVNNAAGPDVMVEAVGCERVLLGFPGAGGERDGHIVHYHILPSSIQATTLGELNGGNTARLRCIAQAFERAGFPIALSRNMDAWLKTHVALVSPMANAVYLAGGDNVRLARTRDGAVLMVRAIREGFQVLRKLAVPITPPKLRVIDFIPEPILVVVLQRALASKWAQGVIAGHANVARDEMQQLADEFRGLVRAAAVPTPAIDRLYTFIDPQVPPMRESSSQLPLAWSGMSVAVGMLMGVGAISVSLMRVRRRTTSL